jgi:predicted nucleotidyltransferase
VNHIQQRIENLSGRYRLTAIYAFGSRIKDISAAVYEGKMLPSSSLSDMDIAVLPDVNQRLTLRQKVRLTFEFEDIFGVASCDLVNLPEADPFLAVQIIRGDRIYCGDTHRADEYELYVLRRAGDLILLEKERIELIMGRT